AIAAYREAIHLKPDDALAHCGLGLALLGGGQHDEAVAELRRGHDLGSKRPGWPHPSAEWVRQAEQRVALAGRLTAVLRGDHRPADPAEGVVFALLAHHKRRYVAAARLWADALAADPKLAADPQAQHRYNAACSAARAAAGEGEDDPMPDDA